MLNSFKIEKNVQITSSKQINRKNATKNVYELQKRMKNTGKQTNILYQVEKYIISVYIY